MLLENTISFTISCAFSGATTFSKITFRIMTLSIRTVNLTKLETPTIKRLYIKIMSII